MMRTTSIDQDAGIVNLTIVLARVSEEWIASDWPLCVISETATPHSRSLALCQGQREVFELFHRYGPGYAFTLLELVTSALALSSALAQTKPRTRGRARQ